MGNKIFSFVIISIVFSTLTFIGGIGAALGSGIENSCPAIKHSHKKFLSLMHSLSPPTILYPKGGDVLVGNTKIEWDSAWCSEEHDLTYTFYYSSNGGSTWELLIDGLTDSTGFQYTWDTSTVPDGDYILKLVATCSGGLQATDISSTPFRISNVAHEISTPHFLNPTSGCYYYFNGPGYVPVSWTKAICSHGHEVTYTLSYSPNAGSAWYEIASNLSWRHPSSGYPWDVFYLQNSSSYLVKINASCTEGKWVETILPRPFTIYLAKHMLSRPIIQYPNGNEILSGVITIKWTPSVDLLNHTIQYTIYYSSNSGTTWNQLVTDLSNTSFEWDTNNYSDGAGYLIRVRGTCSEGLSCYDESNDRFRIDNTPPDIEHNPGVVIKEGKAGYAITWNSYDPEPYYYTITKDNELIINSTWNGGEITISLEGLTKGTYYYVCTVYDKARNLASDTSVVTVVIAPQIDYPEDVIYEEGTVNHTITWHPTDDNPATYKVTRDGELIENGTWMGEVITINVDGLAVGIYTFVCTVSDYDRNSESNTVIVWVQESTQTITSSTNWVSSPLLIMVLFIILKRQGKKPSWR